MLRLFTFCLLLSINAWAQEALDRKEFFNSEETVVATLTTDFSMLIEQKKEPVYQQASLRWHNAEGGVELEEQLMVKLRGNFRRLQCSFASMMFDFRDSTKESRLRKFKNLKIVVPCEWGSTDEQWVIKEYLVYKIFQLFTDKSFKVRLMHFNFNDTSGYFKPYKQYGFVLEPIDDLAKRNNAKEVKDEVKVGTEETDRMHTTLVSIFQYMIGNSDWAIPPKHNVKLIDEKDAPGVKPFVVPYDFDYCGLVNALYAEPAPFLNIDKVTQRLYFGFPRNPEEINAVLKLFFEREQVIYKLIAEYPLLKQAGKDEMTNYIKSFYEIIRNDAAVKKIFIDEAKGFKSSS